MNAAQTENLCTHLSPLLKNIIRSKILKLKEPSKTYNFGQALIFFLADMLTGSKLVTQDQLRVLLEEFSDRIVDFGIKLEAAWKAAPVSNLRSFKSLPVCKIGFLDRQLVCIDGQDTFLDLNSGERVPSTDNLPLEVIAYNLTTLHVRYNNQLKKVSSAELEAEHGDHRS